MSERQGDGSHEASMATDQGPYGLQKEQCDCCDSPNVDLVRNDKIYGEIFGDWPLAYLCDDCDAFVHCHPDTIDPMGRMANKKTRVLRIHAHQSFDVLWKQGLLSRTEAYQWLSDSLDVPPEGCHFSMISDEQLEKTVVISEQKVADLRAVVQERRDRGLEYGQCKARRKHNREVKRSSRLSECSP